MLIILNILKKKLDNTYFPKQRSIKTTDVSHSEYGKIGEYQLFWLEALLLTWEQQ